MSFAKRYLARHRASRCLWTGVLPGAVSQRGPAGGEEAAATAWYAETVVPFFCSTFGDSLARVGVRKDGFINHVFSIFSKIAHLTTLRNTPTPDRTSITLCP